MVLRTASNGENIEFDEYWNGGTAVEKTFPPVVYPHQYSPTRAAAAAVVTIPHCNIHVSNLWRKTKTLHDSQKSAAIVSPTLGESLAA